MQALGLQHLVFTGSDQIVFEVVMNIIHHESGPMIHAIIQVACHDAVMFHCDGDHLMRVSLHLRENELRK